MEKFSLLQFLTLLTVAVLASGSVLVKGNYSRRQGFGGDEALLVCIKDPVSLWAP